MKTPRLIEMALHRHQASDEDKFSLEKSIKNTLHGLNPLCAEFW